MFFKKHWFKFFLLLFAVACGLFVWHLLDALWVNMIDYEYASESGAVEDYFARFAAGDYDTAADTCEFPFTDRAPRVDYIRYLKETFGSDFSHLRFAGRDGETENEKLYNIYDDSTLLGTVHLVAREMEGRKWTVMAPAPYAPSVKVVAPAYVTVSANGVAATESDRSDVPAIEDADFKPLEYLVTVPTKVTYVFAGYLYAPEITAVAPDGTVCRKEIAEDGTIVFSVPEAEGQTEALTEMMSGFSLAYARWIATDGYFSAVQPYLDRTTRFYKDLTEFVNYWFTEHDGYEFRNISASNFSRPADGLLAGTFSFDHVVFYKGEEIVYNTSYRLLYRWVEDRWLLAGLTILR